jgi:hypothetical protein
MVHATATYDHGDQRLRVQHPFQVHHSGLDQHNIAEQSKKDAASQNGASASVKGHGVAGEDSRLKVEPQGELKVEVEVKVEPELTQPQVKFTDGVPVSVPGVDHVGTEAVVTHKGAASLQLRDVVVVGREERVILMGEVKALHLDWRARFLVMLWRLVAPRGREYASNLDCYPLDDEPTDGEPRATQATDVGWLRYTAPAMLRSLVDRYILQRSQAGGQRGMRLTRLQAAEWLKQLISRALDGTLTSLLEHKDLANWSSRPLSTNTGDSAATPS